MELLRQFGIIGFSMGIWNCSDSVQLFGFLLDLGTVATVWHYLVLYGTLELFWQCGIICFYMGLWNCSDSVTFFCVSMWLWNCSNNLALFVSLLDFGTVPTVWHYLFFYCTFEQFWQCEYYLFFYGVLELFPQFANNGLSIGLWNWSDSLTLLVFHLSIGLWNCSDSVTLFGFLLGFGSVRQCGIIGFSFVYWTLELFWQCIIYLLFYVTLELFQQFGIICFSIGHWNFSDSVALFVFW